MVPQCSHPLTPQPRSGLLLCGPLFSFNFLKVPKFNQTGENSHPTIKILVLCTFHIPIGKDGTRNPFPVALSSHSLERDCQTQEVWKDGAQPTTGVQQGQSVDHLTNSKQAKTLSSARTQRDKICPPHTVEEKGATC